MDARAKSDILLEFLEIVCHSVLYFRNIYPKSIFCLKKKYQIPIHVSIHPEVNNYIKECLKTAQELFNQDGLKQIAVVIVTESHIPLEKYCFDFEKSDEGISDFYFIKTEEIFRQYLLKLSAANLKDLPENCTFQIQIITKKSCSVRLNENSDQACAQLQEKVVFKIFSLVESPDDRKNTCLKHSLGIYCAFPKQKATLVIQSGNFIDLFKAFFYLKEKQILCLHYCAIMSESYLADNNIIVIPSHLQLF